MTLLTPFPYSVVKIFLPAMSSPPTINICMQSHLIFLSYFCRKQRSVYKLNCCISFQSMTGFCSSWVNSVVGSADLCEISWCLVFSYSSCVYLETKPVPVFPEHRCISMQNTPCLLTCTFSALSAGPLSIESTAEGFRLYCLLKYYINQLKTSWQFKWVGIQTSSNTFLKSENPHMLSWTQTQVCTCTSSALWPDYNCCHNKWRNKIRFASKTNKY